VVRSQKLDSVRLERLIFKHVTSNYYLVADAWDGRYIKDCINDFMLSSCGRLKDSITVGYTTIGIAGKSNMVAFIGHNGLLEFTLDDYYLNTDGKTRDVIILSCISKDFFSPYLESANVNPVVWTSGLMCPEAYTLHDALIGYVIREKNEAIRSRAALAYSKYQKCSKDFARDLLVTGW
jgi:hypothetical protein